MKKRDCAKFFEFPRKRLYSKGNKISMKKISFLVLPFLLTACFSKTSITPIPQENIVSKEVAPVVKIEDPKPIIAPNETEKAII
jgi:hypothetical protein